jgi:hypothetical protein
MPGPIRPQDVTVQKAAQIPEKVFEVFNLLIVRGWNGHSSVVLQDEVVRLLKAEGISGPRIDTEHLLDVEDIYRAEGWDVRYSAPGYNETGRSTYTFSKKRGG